MANAFKTDIDLNMGNGVVPKELWNVSITADPKVSPFKDLELGLIKNVLNLNTDFSAQFPEAKPEPLGDSILSEPQSSSRPYIWRYQ
jgi:hypothetical protein